MSGLEEYRVAFNDFLKQKGYKTNDERKALGMPPNPKGTYQRMRQDFTPVWRASHPAKAPVKSHRPTLPRALHSCASLDEEPCEVAPNCYWQPKIKKCATRSGKEAVDMFTGPDRTSMLRQVRGQTAGRYVSKHAKSRR